MSHGRRSEPEAAPSWTPDPAPPAEKTRRMSHADFLPNVPSDSPPAPEPRGREDAPRIVTPESESNGGAEANLDEALRAPETPSEGRMEVQSSVGTDRPHFLRPPRPTLDKE